MTVALLVASVAPAGAASTERPTDAVVVDLEADGSATMTVRSTYDLGSDDERDAFEELRSDEQAREDIRTTFRDRMRLVAESAENATGREMAVTNASVDLTVVENTDVENTDVEETDVESTDIGNTDVENTDIENTDVEGTDVESTRVLTLSTSWEGLAAVESDRLTVDEPFASGFGVDRPVILHAPEHYALADAMPTPDDTETAPKWNAGADLDGFEVSFERSTDTAGDKTATSGPGFGVVAAILGVSALGAHRLRN